MKRNLRPVLHAVITLSVLFSAALHAEQTAGLRGNVVATAQPSAIVGSGLQQVRWASVATLTSAESSLELQFFTEGERGNAAQMVHDVRRERAHVAELSLHDLLAAVPELSVALAPYVFESDAEARFVFDNYLFNTFGDLLAEQNLLLLHWLDLGWQGIYSAQPLGFPDSGENVSIGGRDHQIIAEYFTAVGARFVPLSAYQESLSGRFNLDGRLCRLLSTCFSIDAEIAKNQTTHLLLTSHSYDVGVLVANKNWFDGATVVQRQALRKVLSAGVLASRGAVRRLRHDAIAKLTGHQVQVATLSLQQTHELREIGQALLPELVERIGGSAAEVWDVIQSGRRAYAATLPAAEVGAAQ